MLNLLLIFTKGHKVNVLVYMPPSDGCLPLVPTSKMSHKKSQEYRSILKSRFLGLFSAFNKLKIDVEIHYHLSPMNC